MKKYLAKIDNKVSKRLKDTELSERETMSVIEDCHQRLDSLSGSNFEPCSSNEEIALGEGSIMWNAHELDDVQELTSQASHDRLSTFSPKTQP